MQIIIFINLCLVLISLFLPNEFLKMNSFFLFGGQILSMIPYIVSRLEYVKNLFLPSFFVLFYYLINQFLGSYLVPREYGFNKEFAPDLLSIENYNIIISYFLFSNVALFSLNCISIKKLNSLLNSNPNRNIGFPKLPLILELLWLIVFGGIFYIAGFLEILMFYSIQLSVFVVLFSYVSFHKKKYRFIIYLLSIYLIIIYSFESKREVVVVLFLIIFLETYNYGTLLKFGFKRVLLYISGILFFFALVLTSSILRGYGDFDTKSVPSAITYVPQYLNSDIFVDGLTDNLELNYNYGISVTAMDMIIKGDLDYQYGLTIIKLLFLPVPRELFPNKPESIMQLYTKKRDLNYWENGGSLPVVFFVESFLNFNLLGIFLYFFIWYTIDRVFIYYHLAINGSFLSSSCLFVFITVLFFARGSGLEQYFQYYLFALPLLLLNYILKFFFTKN